MNFFDDEYRAQATVAFVERFHVDYSYAGVLLAFIRGERRYLTYAASLRPFL